MVPRKQNRYVVHQIIENYNNFSDIFEHEDYFNYYKSKIGNTILIPNPINNEFLNKINISRFNKLKKDLMLNQGLLSSFYNNGSFNDYLSSKGLIPFSQGELKESIDNRTYVLNRIIKDIWNYENI